VWAWVGLKLEELLLIKASCESASRLGNPADPRLVLRILDRRISPVVSRAVHRLLALLSALPVALSSRRTERIVLRGNWTAPGG